MGIFNWIKNFFTFDPTVYKPPVDSKPEMNQGDFHSGPEGYSPNTAYPETFYGSGGESDSGHNEGDFNR
jgi:hypothetical protein